MLDYNLFTNAIGELDEKSLLTLVKEFLSGTPDAGQAKLALSACQDGMRIVGDRFEQGEYFIGDMIFAGEMLREAFDAIMPVSGKKEGVTVGKIVLGTVKDDLHNIGKNIFKNMAESAGFEVFDLGIDVPASAFVEKVKEVKPQIVGLSGVLTLAIDSMTATINALKDAGLRDDVKITIGGACASREAMEVTGADMWSTSAAKTVSDCLKWVGAA